ncbi:MAG: FRG domain-containing protein [Bacteroidales bacterium]|nr:FRG domain-containing protein [Bacteroidales bacterium]
MIIKIDKNPVEITEKIDYLKWRTRKWKENRNTNLYKAWYKEMISRRYDKIAELRFHDTWIDFAKEFRDYKFDQKRLFRGHSNGGTPDNFEFWDIRSSLNRNHPSIESEDFLLQLRNGIRNINKYSYFEKFHSASNIKDLDVFSFLQHYGIPTPLIDFSFDPLTAFYFSISGIPFEYATGSDNRFLSIFELNCDVLINDFHLIYFDNELNPSLFAHRDMVTAMNPMTEFKDYSFASGLKTGIIPQDKLSKELNPNFTKQDGAFIFLDIPNRAGKKHEEHYRNKNLRTIASFEDILLAITDRKGISIKPLTLHLIPYESIYLGNDDEIFSMPDVVLFYLALHNKTGYDLFADIQGFRYDFLFNNMKQYSRVYSFLRKDNSQIRNFLISRGLI